MLIFEVDSERNWVVFLKIENLLQQDELSIDSNILYKGNLVICLQCLHVQRSQKTNYLLLIIYYKKMKTIEMQTIKLEQDELDGFRLGLCDKTLSLLKSFRDKIAKAFDRVSWEDMQRNEEFIADCLAHYWF